MIQCYRLASRSTSSQQEEQEKAAREAKRSAKQKESSVSVNRDADKSNTGKDEGRAGGVLAGACVEKEGSGKVIMPSVEESNKIIRKSVCQKSVLDAVPKKTALRVSVAMTYWLSHCIHLISRLRLWMKVLVTTQRRRG